VKKKYIIKLLYSCSILCILVLLLSGLTYLTEISPDKNRSINQITSELISVNTKHSQAHSISNHKMDVTLNTVRKYIFVQHEVIWINTTNHITSEVQFHLYPNAFKNENTLYMRGRNFKNSERSEIEFEKVLVNKQTAEFIYIHPEIPNEADETTAKIILPAAARPGDSVRFDFTYAVPVPKGGKRFGYATGRNFFFISQWYPKPGVFENGKWTCSQYHPYTNYYSDFGTYDVKITVPDTYLVASSGGAMEPTEKKPGWNTYRVRQDNIHDFAWMASDEIKRDAALYKRSDGTSVSILTFIQPENTKYKERFITAVKNSLGFLEHYIGKYPYSTITLVDVPRTSLSGAMEYPTLITVNAGLFSSIETQEPESVTVHEFTHQYFYGIVANNEVYEAWLDEGITTYLTEKILRKYYGSKVISFDLFNYYPVYGLNFLSYNEIPLIYSLGKFYYPEGTFSLSRYLREPQLYAITDTSYLHPDGFLYGNASYSKPHLVLLSLERYLGFEKMMMIFKSYYNTNKFRHPTGVDFINTIQKNAGEDLTWFFELFRGSAVFDYKIKYIRKAYEKNTYDVYIERLGDGIFRQDVALYTKSDTLIQKWDGKERWKILNFRTSDEVIGAEVDPFRKNILDLNYANNSYFIKYQYGGSLGLTFRWFFWMQNLLLILGSVA